MQVKMIASIRHLIVKSNIDVKVDGGVISTAQHRLSQILTKDFYEMVGTTECNLLTLHPFYFEEKRKLEKLPTEVAENAHSFLIDYLTCLWFIKDNSCNSGNFFVIAEGNEPQTFYAGQMRFNSNCAGNFKPTEFDAIELKKAMAFHRRLSKIFKIDHHDDGSQLQRELRESQYSYQVRGLVNDDGLNILARAFQLLQQARSTFEIPLKISNLVIVLECLFSYENSEVSYRVSERCAFFLAKKRDKREEIFETVKEAYTIRSLYVHGQTIPRKRNKLEFLLPLSQKLDEIVRQAFIKYIREHEKQNLSDDEVKKQLFKDLLFK